MQVPVELPPQLAPWNEPWFRDKPVPLAKPTPSLFPADEEQLANVLDCELNGARKWDVSKLLEHMFSDEVLGLPITELEPAILEGFENKGLVRNGAFTTKLDSHEANAASFLNRTAGVLERVLKEVQAPPGFKFKPPTCRRRWSSQWLDRCPSGSHVFRKPDLVLLDTPLPDSGSLSSSDKVSWVKIKAFGEVTAQSSFHRDLKNTIDAKTYILFLTQHDRNFVPAIIFFGNHFVLTVTDRQSQQFSRLLRLHDDRPDDIMVFLRVLIGLMFSGDHVLGLDTTMRRNKMHEIKSIYVEGRKYNVIKLLYSVQSLLGRATKVWQVEHDGRTYVLKDSWIIASRLLESDALKDLNIKGIMGIPRFVAGGAVVHPQFTEPGRPVPLRTSLFRFSTLSHNLEARERRRVVEGPHAGPLSSFKSRLEVCVAFRDYVEALEAMAEAGWVHRDISYNNVMLYTPSDEYPAKPYADTKSARRGTLIDLDYTVPMQETRDGVRGSVSVRTGTAPYMALSILINDGKNVLHTPQHDLESLLYLLFDIFTRTNGPGNLCVTPDATSIPLLEWFEDISSYRKLGRIKQGQLADFSYAIKDKFTDYWKPLADVAHALFRATFPNGVSGHAPEPQIQHRQMVTILNATIFLLGQSDNDDIFPRIMTMPSAKKSSSRDSSVTRNGPTYPKKRSASRVEASEEEAAPPRKRSRTGKTTKRSVSGVEASEEESAPPRKRSRIDGSLRSEELSSPYESADSLVSIDNLPTTIIRRLSQNRSSVLQTTSCSSGATFQVTSSSFQATSSSSRVTPEFGTRGEFETVTKPASLCRSIIRRGSTD